MGAARSYKVVAACRRLLGIVGPKHVLADGRELGGVPVRVDDVANLGGDHLLGPDAAVVGRDALAGEEELAAELDAGIAAGGRVPELRVELAAALRGDRAGL